MIRVGDPASSYTGRTPIRLQPGQNLKMTLGGEGRPVIGRFVPPADYKEPVYFGCGSSGLCYVAARFAAARKPRADDPA